MRVRSIVGLTGVFAVLAVLANPAFAAVLFEEEPAPSWLRFLGRLHPMIVHFPIALIVTAGGLEALHLMRGKESHSPTALVCIRLGALSAAAAAGAGWILADTQTFGRAVESTVLWHRWLGISALAFAVIASVAGAAVERGLGARLYRVTLFAALLAVSGAGHLGGELVHGEDYLFEVFSKSEPALAIEAPESVYAQKIAPILEESCYSCHGPEKQKGKLRLDSKGEAFKGDRATWLIIPGNAAESELFKRVSLPADDFDIMPADGDTLSPEAIEALRSWIDNGAEWPE